MWGKFWFRVALFCRVVDGELDCAVAAGSSQAGRIRQGLQCLWCRLLFTFRARDTCLRVGSYARTDVGAFSFQTSQGAVCNNRYGRYFTSDAESCGRRPDKPLEYVKVCSVYSSGYYYVPGTDTCIRIGAWVRDNDGRRSADFIRHDDIRSAELCDDGRSVVDPCLFQLSEQRRSGHPAASAARHRRRLLTPS